MYFIGWLWDFVREAAVLAAAVGLAKWAWDQHNGAAERRDIEARVAMEEGRARAELKAYQDAVQGETRAREERSQLKVRIHRLIHASADPFLTFAELRDGVGRGGEALPEEGLLRRALMELVAERSVAQMERDRYFVGGEYEADEEQDDPA